MTEPHPTPGPNRPPADDDVRAALARALPADRVVVDPDVMASYGADRATAVAPGRPAAVVRARSTAEVQAAVRVAAALSCGNCWLFFTVRACGPALSRPSAQVAWSQVCWSNRRDTRANSVPVMMAELTMEPRGKSWLSWRVKVSVPSICTSLTRTRSSMRCSTRTGWL